MDTETGLVSWIPSTTGNFPVQILASNAAGSDTQTYTIVVTGPPNITSSPITDGTVGEPYSYQVVASGTQPMRQSAPFLAKRPRWPEIRSMPPLPPVIMRAAVR